MAWARGTWHRLFLTLALTVTGSSGAPEAEAAEWASCTVTFVLLLDPGFSMQGSRGHHHSERPGVLNCEGLVNGSPVTGAGTLTDDGPYGTEDPDSCISGSEGSGLDHITLPTEAGPQVVDSNYTYTAAKPSNGSPFRGQFTGSRFTGTFEFRPLEGDCVSAPITKIEVKARGLIRD